MEVDVEISFSLINKKSYSPHIINSIKKYYDIVDIDQEKGNFLISKEYELKEISLSDVIIDFLIHFEDISILNLAVEKFMKLGIYYDLKETVTFPVILTNSCISSLSKTNVSLDISGYPCDEK